MIWYKENNDNIVISTRIRLARNLDNLPFPNALENKADAIKKIKAAIDDGNSVLSDELQYIELDKLSLAEKEKLAEEHLISPQMLKGSDKSVFISKDKTMSIMLMEEDHIRLQVIMGANTLSKAYDIANKIDDCLEEQLTYAFDEEFGYLTACPTNTGTGMRASLMLHLPALTITRNINKVISSASALGIAVRGLYGEGTTADGNFYQISNQVTMGVSEVEIIKKLQTIVEQVVDMEKKARKALENNPSLIDRVYRSYGTLKYARRITSAEAKTLISDVILGRDMGIIKETGNLSPLECIINSAPSFISNGKTMTADERDEKRADMIRKNI